MTISKIASFLSKKAKGQTGNLTKSEKDISLGICVSQGGNMSPVIRVPR